MFGYFDTDLGRVRIAPAIVRGIILQEIRNSECFCLPGTEPGGDAGRKAAERNIRVNFVDGAAEVVLALSVRYGARIIKEARELQGKIARTLQLSAGLPVLKISVNVECVFERPAAGKALPHENEAAMHVDAVNQ